MRPRETHDVVSLRKASLPLAQRLLRTSHEPIRSERCVQKRHFLLATKGRTQVRLGQWSLRESPVGRESLEQHSMMIGLREVSKYNCCRCPALLSPPNRSKEDPSVWTPSFPVILHKLTLLLRAGSLEKKWTLISQFHSQSVPYRKCLRCVCNEVLMWSCGWCVVRDCQPVCLWLRAGERGVVSYLPSVLCVVLFCLCSACSLCRFETIFVCAVRYRNFRVSHVHYNHIKHWRQHTHEHVDSLNNNTFPKHKGLVRCEIKRELLAGQDRSFNAPRFFAS